MNFDVTLNGKINMESSSDYVFTLFYLILSIGLIYPPTEFISAGITIPYIFQRFLGNEYETFTAYHIRQSCVTLLVYSLLPLGYIITSCLFGYVEVSIIFIFINQRLNIRVLGKWNFVVLFTFLESICCHFYWNSHTDLVSNNELDEK